MYIHFSVKLGEKHMNTVNDAIDLIMNAINNSLLEQDQLSRKATDENDVELFQQISHNKKMLNQWKSSLTVIGKKIDESGLIDTNATMGTEYRKPSEHRQKWYSGLFGLFNGTKRKTQINSSPVFVDENLNSQGSREKAITENTLSPEEAAVVELYDEIPIENEAQQQKESVIPQKEVAAPSNPESVTNDNYINDIADTTIESDELCPKNRIVSNKNDAENNSIPQSDEKHTFEPVICFPANAEIVHDNRFPSQTSVIKEETGFQKVGQTILTNNNNDNDIEQNKGFVKPDFENKQYPVTFSNTSEMDIVNTTEELTEDTMENTAADTTEVSAVDTTEVTTKDTTEVTSEDTTDVTAEDTSEYVTEDTTENIITDVIEDEPEKVKSNEHPVIETVIHEPDIEKKASHDLSASMSKEDDNTVWYDVDDDLTYQKVNKVKIFNKVYSVKDLTQGLVVICDKLYLYNPRTMMQAAKSSAFAGDKARIFAITFTPLNERAAKSYKRIPSCNMYIYVLLSTSDKLRLIAKLISYFSLDKKDILFSVRDNYNPKLHEMSTYSHTGEYEIEAEYHDPITEELKIETSKPVLDSSPTQKEKTEVSDQIADSTMSSVSVPTDYSSYTFLGIPHSVSGQSDFIVSLTELMVIYAPFKMIVADKSLNGFISSDSYGSFKQPKKLSNGLYVESELTESDCISYIERLITYCGYCKENLVVGDYNV